MQRLLVMFDGESSIDGLSNLSIIRVARFPDPTRANNSFLVPAFARNWRRYIGQFETVGAAPRYLFAIDVISTDISLPTAAFILSNIPPAIRFSPVPTIQTATVLSVSASCLIHLTKFSLDNFRLLDRIHVIPHYPCCEL